MAETVLSQYGTCCFSTSYLEWQAQNAQHSQATLHFKNGSRNESGQTKNPFFWVYFVSGTKRIAKFMPTFRGFPQIQRLSHESLCLRYFTRKLDESPHFCKVRVWFKECWRKGPYLVSHRCQPGRRSGRQSPPPRLFPPSAPGLPLPAYTACFCHTQASTQSGEDKKPMQTQEIGSS